MLQRGKIELTTAKKQKQKQKISQRSLNILNEFMILHWDTFIVSCTYRVFAEHEF